MGMFTSNNNYNFQNPANMGQNNMFGGSFNGGNLQNSAMNYNIAQNIGPGAQQYIPGFFPQQAQQPYFPQQPPQQQPPPQQYPQQPPPQQQYPQYPQQPPPQYCPPQYPQYCPPQYPQYCPPQYYNPVYCPPQEPQMPTIIQQPIYYPVQQQQPDFPNFPDFPNYPQQPPQQPPQQQPPQQDQSLLLLFALLKLLGNRNNPPPAPTPAPAPVPPPAPEEPYRRHHTDPPPTTVGGGGDGNVWGDPHFNAIGGGNYDVQGQDGKIYSLLSDKTLQINGKFSKYNNTDGVNVITEAGIKSGNDKIDFDITKATPKITIAGKEQDMEVGKTYDIDGGGKATFDGTKLTISNAEHTATLTKVENGANSYMNIDDKISDKGYLNDYTPTHGLLGQSADGDTNARNGKVGVGAQGEGAIDGVYTDYEEKDIFGSDSKFDRFGKDTDVRVEDGKVTRIFDKQGNVLVTQDAKGNLVSVRRIRDDKGQDVLYLADGTTKIDKDGGIVKAA